MALIQHIESAGSPEKSVRRATLNLGVDDDIGVGGLGGVETGGEMTEQVIHLRTALLILAGSVE